MCTPDVAAIIQAGSLRGLSGKKIIGSDIFPKTPSPPTPAAPPDVAGEERRKRFRALEQRLKGRPGAGRAANINPTTTTGTTVSTGRPKLRLGE